MSSLTDNELRDKLREYGFESGPIVPSTRKVYERKLDRLIKESKGGSTRLRSNDNQPVDLVKKEGSVSPNVFRQLNWSSFVSGPSERASTPLPHTESRHQSQLFSPSAPSFVPQQNPGHTPTAGPRAPLRAVNANVTYDSPSPSSEGPRMAHKYSTPSGVQPRSSSGGRGPISLTGQPRSRELGPDAMRDADTSTSNSLLLTPNAASRRSFWSGWQPRASSAGSCLMSDESNTGDADISRWVSQSEKTAKRSQPMGPNFDSSFFSRFSGLSFGSQVPNLILLCGTILFAVIASSYLLLKDKHGNVGRIADFQKVICHPNEPYDREAVAIPEKSACINGRDLPLVLKIVHPLFEILSRFAGEYRCGESVESSKMEVGTAKRLVKGYFGSSPVSHISENQVDDLWRSVLILITEVGRKHLEIAAYDGDGLHPVYWQDVQELESLRPYIPGSCRLRLLFFSLLHFLNNLFWLLLILSVVGGVCYVVYRVKLSHQSRTSKREMRVREIVYQVIGLLQQQLHVRQTHPAEPPYIPVSVIKETLSHTNKDLADVWKDVEHHVHLVEGCILVQEWRGLGETWQWQGGSGWQGSALPDKSQRLPFTTPPTECLKVRNMFTRDTFDANMERRLKRELLNHIAECGAILHIGLDYQNNQGLVYIKCASPAVAGRVYEAIHANYFDSHLLTVKFLRAVKYYLRFPEACNAVTPLNAADFE
uniref:LEM domain-containing protein n=1 Tax=Mesocestoides corti TaxID=53468 RepID=A0A5K3ETE2_MESCO